MSDNLIVLSGPTTLDIDPERVLDAASGELGVVMIVGTYKETENLYVASSTGDIGKMLLLIELLKKAVLEKI